MEKNLYCSICKTTKILNSFNGLIKHYISHNIGNYQCRFCLCACTYPEEMHYHYAKYHPTEYPRAVVRKYNTLRTVRFNQRPLSDLVVVDLSLFYADSSHKAIRIAEYLKDCPPYQPSPIQEDTKDNPERNESLEIDNTTKTLTQNVDKQIEIETINLIDDDVIESEKETETEKTSLSEPMITLKHRNTEKENEIINAVDPLSIDLDALESEETYLNQDNLQTDADKKTETSEVLNDPGLKGHKLFRCGTIDCHFSAETANEFKEHLFCCDVLKQGGYYTCIHCAKSFKYPGALTEHIFVHGTLKYTCSLCDVRAPFEHMIVKHLKTKHKIQSCKVIPVSSSQSHASTYVAVPGTNRGKRVSKDGVQLKEDGNKIAYEPEEADMLPRAAIYPQELKCARCEYATKVRTNLWRHLHAHLNDAPVPETAPVNPVPCLDRTEKMFDKMLNLANSSFSGCRMGKDKNLANKEDNLPAFVPANKRFVCGAEGCNYLTHGDSMLKCHFNALHADEESYKCPHCKIDLIDEFGDVNIDQIVFHLRMHDLHLYKCSICQYYHYQKHKVEKHLQDKHPDKEANIQVIRELDNSANVNTDERNKDNQEKQKEIKEDKPWKCGFCKFQTASEEEIQSHVSQKHGVDSQYKCSLCSYKCDNTNNLNYHAKANHANSEVSLFAAYVQINDPSVDKNISGSHNESDSFDTTPLWRRDSSRVKIIRGILVEDEAESPKRPCKENYKNPENVSKNLFEGLDSNQLKIEIDSKEAISDLIKSYGDFGSPVGNKFACPFCLEYQTVFKRKFVSHVYKELKYNK